MNSLDKSRNSFVSILIISRNFNPNKINILIINILIIINLNIIKHNKSSLEMFFRMNNFLNMRIVQFNYLMVNSLDQMIHAIILKKIIFKIIQAPPKCLKAALFLKIIISRIILNKNQIRNLNKIHFLLLHNFLWFKEGTESQVLIWERLA